MTIQFSELTLAASNTTNVLRVSVSGKLTADDYALFVPKVEELITRHGCVRILFEMKEFHGWTASAMWEDVKFDVKHFRDIERIAMIGDKSWEHGMATFCRPFTSAKIQYFDHDDADRAETWITED